MKAVKIACLLSTAVFAGFSITAAAASSVFVNNGAADTALFAETGWAIMPLKAAVESTEIGTAEYTLTSTAIERLIDMRDIAAAEAAEAAALAEAQAIQAAKEAKAAELEALLREAVSQYEGDWSLYFKDADSGIEISINSHRVYSASLIKLYVAQAVYTKIYEGILADTAETEELLWRMITWSDNDAWRSLAALMGGGSYSAGMEYVTLIAQATGFADSGRFDNTERSNFNFTSVNDCGKYLTMLLDGTIVNADYSSRILELMKQQQITHKIPAGVPEGVTVANKTGELDYMQGDAAIVYAPSGTYILVVIADDVSDYACTGITELSRITYDFLNN